MYIAITGWAVIDAKLQVFTGQRQLTMKIPPFTHAHKRQKLLVAVLAQLVLGQRLALLLIGFPEIDVGHEIRVIVIKLTMPLIRCLLFVLRTFARVLHRQGTDDNQCLMQSVVLVRLDQHSTEARVHRQLAQLAAGLGDTSFFAHGTEFLQQFKAVVNGLAVRRINKWKSSDVAQPHAQHLQDNCRQVGAQNFRIGKLRAREEVFFRVETNTDPLGHPATATFTLIGRSLGDRFHRQSLHF